MRKTVAGVILAISVSVVSVTEATYVIKLKNGNEYITNRYWQGGTQILFDAEGGIFGVEKQFVNRIDETDKVIKLASVAPQDPSEKIQTEAARETKDTEATNQETHRKEGPK